MQEFNLIDKFLKPLCANNTLDRNLSDDTASLQIKNDEELVISKDIFVENIHFKFSESAYNIATKLLATNLSDIASSGAKPFSYMLGIGKNSHLDEKFFKEFCAGLKDSQKKFNINLIGGDTVNSPTIFFSLTIFGVSKKNKILSRKKAQIGDLIYTSGTIGDAGLGLNLLAQKNDNFKYLISRHLNPTPRLDLGQNLLEKKLSKCAIDVSDGLLADIKKICEASQISAKIYFDKIPFSTQAKKFLKLNPQHDPLKLLSSGDDYELVFSVKKNCQKKILDLANKLKVNLTCIGEFIKVEEKNDYNVFLYREYKEIQKKNKLTKNNKKQQELIKIVKLGYEHS
jgi:thiamine-monophosphate kinase